ncbi:MAG: putative DNA binding domain-containing protein [Clostridia bacterium]|nr:putative DNA binding domain-containing protein [Clostridia bacterium]
MSEVIDVVNRCLSYGDEPEWFEYKDSLFKPDDIGEYISALSNAAVMAGEPFGYLIWGIDNSTHAFTNTGFNYQKDIKSENGGPEPFQHFLSRNITPSIYFHFDEDVIDKNRVVVLSIPAARKVPTEYRNIRYIRIGSSKEMLKRYPERETALFKRLIENSNPLDDWEIRNSKYSVDDINLRQFKSYLKKAREAGRITIESDEPEDVLNSIKIADGKRLLNAGAAIFVESGINELQIARFATDEKLTIIDSKRYTGSILSLAEKAVLYISDAMDWRAVFEGKTRRNEIPEIPVNAIREAVINAFAHRIIESRQAVEITIFRNFIDIYSYGLFPPNLEPQQFIDRVIRPPRRNPLITQTLYYSRDMEAFATGFKRINFECTQAGVKYEFIKEEYGFTVRFHRHCGEGWSIVSGGQPEKRPEKQPEKADEIILRSDLVLALIREDENISRAKIAKRLKISQSQVRTVLDSLKSSGRLHREGPDKGGRWIID